VTARFFIQLLFISNFIFAAAHISTLAIAEEYNSGVNASPAASAGPLYQVSYKAVQPITGITIGEYSTNEILFSWSSSGRASSAGTYYSDSSSGSRFLLTIKDSGDGGQFISITSRYANLLRIKINYISGTSPEIIPDPPVVLFNCTLDTLPSCTPGGSLPAPYQDCSRIFAGYAELVVTQAGGTMKDFEQNVLQPLKTSPDWDAGDVYTFIFRKLDKGYYAEVRIATHTCLQAVAQKLQGNPDILSAKGRQLIVNYKSTAPPPAPPVPDIQD
jgi:hypothetical protein